MRRRRLYKQTKERILTHSQFQFRPSSFVISCTSSDWHSWSQVIDEHLSALPSKSNLRRWKPKCLREICHRLCLCLCPTAAAHNCSDSQTTPVAVTCGSVAEDRFIVCTC